MKLPNWIYFSTKIRVEQGNPNTLGSGFWSRWVALQLKLEEGLPKVPFSW